MRHIVVILCMGAIAGCGGTNSPSITSPTPQPAPQPSNTPTRVISLSGPVAFGDVVVGTPKTTPLTISNTGNSTLTFTGIGGGFADTLVSATSGTIHAGSSTTLTFRF